MLFFYNFLRSLHPFAAIIILLDQLSSKRFDCFFKLSVILCKILCLFFQVRVGTCSYYAVMFSLF